MHKGTRLSSYFNVSVFFGFGRVKGGSVVLGFLDDFRAERSNILLGTLKGSNERSHQQVLLDNIQLGD